MQFGFMKRAVAGALLGLALVGATPAYAALSAEQRAMDFNQLVNIFERNYAPLRYKKESIGLDWKALVSQYSAKVTQARSDGEFYRILAQFLSNLEDAHVSAVIPSSHKATLGFLSDYVEGKVLIESIDRLRLPKELFPLNVGDQVLSIGGQPVEQVMEEMAKIGKTGNALSTKRIAAARLTSRREAAGLVIPKGVTTITALPRGAAQPITVTATWIVSGTPVIDLDDLAGLMEGGATDNAISNSESGTELLSRLRNMPSFNASLPASLIKEWARAGVSDVGASKSMFTLPEGARELRGISVTAAIYEAAGKRIGILRIPSYDEDSLLEVLARAIIIMEQETDVLVIDQTNNPGGSVSLVSDIVSLFADKSFKDVEFRLRPSLNWMKTMQELNAEIAKALANDPNDMAANALKARFEYLESEVRDSLQERKFFTNPVPLNLSGTFGMIQPSGMVRYTKPVLLLINEFAFSGGDALPAIMQDNNRAVLFGARTTGAGGNVREYGPLSNSFLKFSVTESLMIRPNGKFVENIGVSPDVEYAITTDDFLNGYRGYVQAFTREALKLAGVSPEAIDQWKAKK
jgi:hypothetical protein